MSDPHSLRLRALRPDDVEVISALVQDAVLPVRDIKWQMSQRRLVLLLRRYCWERAAPPAPGSDACGERVATALRFDGVQRLRRRGIDPSAEDKVAWMLGMQFHPGEAPGGEIRFLFSNNAELSAEVECIDGFMIDVSRPWLAAGRPAHSVAD